MYSKILKLWMLFVILISGITFVSCSKDDDFVDPQAEQGAKYRALLKTLNWGTDTCYVYGHKTPDVDAITSALSFSKLMNALGYKCKAKASSPMNRETTYISGIFGFKLPELKTSVAPQARLILTDHTDYAQCVDGAREAIILQKIDHHIEGDIRDDMIPFVRREMVGSTNTIVYEMYKELGVTIDDEAARIMLAGIISDTRNLSKTTTCGIDSVAWLALTSQLGISRDSVARVNQGMEDAAFDYTGMTDVQIFNSDYKDYDINGHLIGIGSLICKQTEMENFIDRMLAVMPEVIIENKRNMLFAMVNNLVPNAGEDKEIKPYVENGFYFLYHGNGAKELAEAVFGASVREGVCFSEKNLSRKQVVPLITEILNQ